MTRHYFRSIKKGAKRKRAAKRAAKTRSIAAKELRREYERMESGVSYSEFRKEKRLSRLYESYSKSYDKLKNDYGATIDKWSRREFSEYLSSGEKRMAAGRFINRSVSLQIGVMPRSEAINLRMQLANAARAAGDTERAEKVAGMSIHDVRSQPRLQSELYNYLKKSGKNPKEASSWWTENIIGSD